MYVAYSEVRHDVVNVNDVFDLNEVFCCPNVNCTAKLKIKGATGKRAKHFARLPSTPHIPVCDYENGDSRYIQPELQKRSSLEDIFNNLYIQSGGSTHENAHSSSATNILRINTPKKLLKFCRMNSLKTEYLPGIMVDDIIVDERNLITNGRFEGIQGLRIIVGKTVEKYYKDKLYMVSTATSKYGKQVYLHISVKMDAALLQYCRKHIEETQGTYEGYEVAVFGNWKLDKKYNISCEVSNKKNIMLEKGVIGV